jgi:uncharacterized protein (DUF362 family)
MLRRQILAMPIAAFAANWQNAKKDPDPDSVTAGATEDATPRVAIILSSFKGSADHDGTPLRGLRTPVPPDAPVTAAQLEAMVNRAIEFGNTRHGGLASLLDDRDWVVIKVRISAQRTPEGRLIAGAVSDPRVVRALAKRLAAKRTIKRITVAEAPAVPGGLDAWTTDWEGAFGGASYRKVVDELARTYPAVKFDILDLTTDETMEMQTPERLGATEAGVYKVFSTLVRCPGLIAVAPLAVDADHGVSLVLGNYAGVVPLVARERRTAEQLVDLFSFHPPDYSIVGGEWGLEGGGAGVRHNVILAGASAVAVDATAAAVMGFKPNEIGHLEVATRRGLGTNDIDLVWTRGNEIDEAKRQFAPAKR